MGPNADRPQGTTPSGRASGDQPDTGGRSARSPTVTIRPGTPDDAPAAGALHAAGISEGFLSALGRSFLRRLYRRICLYPDAFLFVAELDGRVVGFIAGATDVPGLYRSFLVHDGPAAAASGLVPVLRGWRRVLETLRHGSSARQDRGGAELLSVAVDPRRQRHGAARRLVASFLEEAGERGCTSAHVVVGAGNRAAVALYERAGFVTAERFELHRGTESLLMRWTAPHAAPTPGTVTG